MTDLDSADLDELARRCPTALAMALERAITTHDRRLERAVLTALAELGIVVVDRATLADSLAKTRPPRRDRGGKS